MIRGKKENNSRMTILEGDQRVEGGGDLPSVWWTLKR